jgi:serine/threonine protein kinase
MSTFATMAADRLRQFTAVFLFLEFKDAEPRAGTLLPVARLRDQISRIPIFVVARGGDERAAVSAIKMGATDYWPAHSIDVKDLAEALRPLVAARIEQKLLRVPAQRFDLKIPGYRLIKRISQSDSATVFLAQRAETPQPVALKVQMIADMSPGVRQRFLRECELLSAVNHRSVADVIDYGATGDCLYLALEYFPCGSLRDRLKNPLEEAEAFEYAKQIGEALRIIHEMGIVHRDLKPSNLMLTDDNRLVLIDFGLARSLKACGDDPKQELPIGTPYYVSPEQIDGAPPDARSDLYSLGVVLFEMLTGTLPFRGNTVAEIVTSHQASAIPRLPKDVADYQTVIDRLLAKQRADRFDTAAQFIQALIEAHEQKQFGGALA